VLAKPFNRKKGGGLSTKKRKRKSMINGGELRDKTDRKNQKTTEEIFGKGLGGWGRRAAPPQKRKRKTRHIHQAARMKVSTCSERKDRK